MGPVSSFMNYLKANEKMHVAWCVSGIVGCLLLYGVLQVRGPALFARVITPVAYAPAAYAYETRYKAAGTLLVAAAPR